MKTLFYTVALDKKYLDGTVRLMANSFAKFHKEKLAILGLGDVKKAYPTPDYDHTFRVTPLTLMGLAENYDCMVRLDADQVIMGNLDHVTEGDFDVAVVQNSSPRDWKQHFLMTGQRLSVYDVDPLDYVNCGFVVVKSKRFIRHWFGLSNSPFFEHYQFREQDTLNLLVNYFPYKVKYLDRQKDNKWHGLIAKGYTPTAKLEGGKVILPKDGDWIKEDKHLVCYHYAGGESIAKGKYRLLFNDDVSDYISTLIK